MQDRFAQLIIRAQRKADLESLQSVLKDLRSKIATQTPRPMSDQAPEIRKEQPNPNPFSLIGRRRRASTQAEKLVSTLMAQEGVTI